MPDVVGFLDRILPRRVNMVAAAPELPVPILEFQLGKPLVQLQAAFPLQETRHARNRELRGNFEQHVHMVGAHLRLQYHYPLPFAKRTEYLSHLGTLLPVKRLPPEFRRKDYVIFAVPARVCEPLFLYFPSGILWFVVVQCPDRSSNLARGFFQHRQKASLEPPA